MQLTAAEGRVLGSLLRLAGDKDDAASEADSLSLDEVRFACNQSDWRRRSAYDDRVVEDALLALKSKGLASFVGGRGAGPVRYRHKADERWRMSPAELDVLARLLLHGPQTVDEVRAAVGGAHLDVEAALDALAGRTPSPFATRLAPTARNPEVLWAEILTGRPTADELFDLQTTKVRSAASPEPASTDQGSTTAQGPKVAPDRVRGRDPQLWSNEPASAPTNPAMVELADRLAKIERRLASIEATLQALERGQNRTQESDRAIR